MATFTVATVDLPTPPFPELTAMIFDTPGTDWFPICRSRARYLRFQLYLDFFDTGQPAKLFHLQAGAILTWKEK
jgi:hypothetical protein